MQWGGRASARPLPWPRRDYIAPPEEEEKRRSNRLTPRGSQGSHRGERPPGSGRNPGVFAGKLAPERAPAAHSPASKRPIERQRSAATYEGCGGTLPPRCTPAHASRTRRERAHAARAVPATDNHRPAGAHTTQARTRPSSGPPGRGHAPLGHAPRQCAALADTEDRREHGRGTHTPAQSRAHAAAPAQRRSEPRQRATHVEGAGWRVHQRSTLRRSSLHRWV